jgi:hypothetical protein
LESAWSRGTLSQTCLPCHVPSMSFGKKKEEKRTEKGRKQNRKRKKKEQKKEEKGTEKGTEKNTKSAIRRENLESTHLDEKRRNTAMTGETREL